MFKKKGRGREAAPETICGAMLLRPRPLRIGRAEPVDIVGIASEKLHYVIGSGLAPAAVLALRSRSALWE